MPTRAPDYFPTTMSMQNSWTTGPETGVVYGTASQNPGVQHYEFPSEQYVKDEGGSQSQNYTWNPA